MKKQLKYESITVPLPSTDQAHLTRFYRDKRNLGTPVFMLHSTLQDSSTFFSDKGTGLACYLARQGYDVFVGDMRGKGKSWPQVNACLSLVRIKRLMKTSLRWHTKSKCCEAIFRRFG